jgi:tRNA-dihydrouridine synthase 3
MVEETPSATTAIGEGEQPKEQPKAAPGTEEEQQTGHKRESVKVKVDAQKLLELGYAPISEKYLVKRSDLGPDAPAAQQEEEKKQSSGHNRTGKSKNQLKRERREQQDKTSFCQFLARGNCTYGDTCKFNHDMEAFLSNKAADLPGKCLILASTGECRFGISCRYYNSHKKIEEESEAAPVCVPIDFEKMNRDQILEAKEALPIPKRVEKEINFLGKGLQSRLRKRKEAFPAADKILKEMGIRNKNFDKKGKKRNREQQEKENNSAPAIEKGDTEVAKTTPRERKKLDFSNKLYLSPLTTVGNLPYRRICKNFGVDITCGEMAMATNILQGQASEWALLKRHPCEDFFGVQLAGAFPDAIAKASELINRELNVDFIDINMGCPIDLLCHKGGGAALMQKPDRIKTIAKCVSPLLDIPLTLKMRKGYYDGKDIVHNFIADVSSWGVSALTLHGRTREQRYTKTADWDYIYDVSRRAGDLNVIGNGDIYNFEEYNKHISSGKVNTVMIGRAALIKPWIFTEIKEQRHYDISATERLDVIKQYCVNGLEHWGSDSRGVEATRKYLLEWLSFLHRYVPVGLLEVLPQTLGMRPPAYYGRSDLETLLASSKVDDWIKITEMFLGPTPETFSFVPKHKSYSYKVVDGAYGPAVVTGDDFGGAQQNG